MLTQFKKIGYEVVSRMGLPLVQKGLFPDWITIVMYHGVINAPLPFSDWSFIDEGEFRKQIQYLRSHFEIIPLSKVKEKIETRGKKGPFAVITFDDGYQNNYDIAYPILREEGVPATIFLTTGLIDSDQTVWSFHLHHAFSNTSRVKLEWEGRSFNISRPSEKVESLRKIKEGLKRLPQAEVLSRVREIIVRLGVDPDEGLPPESPYRILNRESISLMSDSGLIEFGAHTSSHAILSRLSEADQEKEIRDSLDAVKTLTGKPCSLFAYPNGRFSDYGPETQRILSDHGVMTAVTAKQGYINSETPLLELRRYGIGSDLKMAHFKVMVHHLLSVAKRVHLGKGQGVGVNRVGVQ